MNQSVVLSLFTVLAVGCGANLQSQAQRPEHLVTDGERYAAAIDEAYDAYEAEARDAAAMSFRSDAEAEVLMRTLAGNRLETHLEAALSRRGLSLRGLRVYARNHHGFAADQRALHAAQHDRIDTSLAVLPTHVSHDRIEIDQPARIAAR